MVSRVYYPNDGGPGHYQDGQPEDILSSDDSSVVDNPRKQKKTKKQRNSSKSRPRSSSSKTSRTGNSDTDTKSSSQRPRVLSAISHKSRKNHRISYSHAQMPQTRRQLASGASPAASTPSKKTTNKTPRTSGEKPKKTKEAKKIAELQKQLEEKEKENQEQAQRLEVLSTKKAGKKNKNVVSIPLSDGLKKRVITESGPLGTSLWRTTKFLSNDEQLKTATKQVMGDISDCKKFLEGDPDVVEENVKAFVTTYGSEVCKAINDARSNAQSGLKKAYMERAAEKKPMPTPQELLDVIRRKDMILKEGPKPLDPEKYNEDDLAEAQDQHDLDVKNYEEAKKICAQNKEWFKWYWTALLPKVAGSKRWSQSIRNYGTISEHAPAGKDAKKYITTADEALVQLLYENCSRRFPYLASLPVGKKADPKHPDYQSIYSNAKSGQCKWGGWFMDGRKRFSDLHKAIRVAKKRDHVLEFEQDILKEIRAENNLDNGKGTKRKTRELLDFEAKADELCPIGMESDAMSDLDDDDKSDVEDFCDDFTSNTSKKRKVSKKPKKNSKNPKKNSDGDEDTSEEDEDNSEEDEDGSEEDEETSGEDDDEDGEPEQKKVATPSNKGSKVEEEEEVDDASPKKPAAKKSTKSSSKSK